MSAYYVSVLHTFTMNWLIDHNFTRLSRTSTTVAQEYYVNACIQEVVAPVAPEKTTLVGRTFFSLLFYLSSLIAGDVKCGWFWLTG